MSPAHTSLRKTRIDMTQGTLVLHVTAAALKSTCGLQWGHARCKEMTHGCGGCRLIQPMLDELKALTAAHVDHNAAINNLACRKELTRECGARRLIQPMLDELKALTAARAGHNAAMNVGAGVLGSRILQILEVTAAVVVPPPPKKSIFSRAVSSPPPPPPPPNQPHSASRGLCTANGMLTVVVLHWTMAGRCSLLS